MYIIFVFVNGEDSVWTINYFTSLNDYIQYECIILYRKYYVYQILIGIVFIMMLNNNSKP